jgi:hypothetical protein
MSDDTDLDDQDDQGNLIRLSRDQIRGLESKAKRADDAEARAATAERELAFAKAGIDLNDSKLSYFRKGYEGDLDADQIRAAAAEAGFIAPPGGPADDADLVAQQRIAMAGSEAVAPADPSPLRDKLAAAQSEEEIMAIVNESQELRAASED